MIRRHETTILFGQDTDARPVVVREITPGMASLFHKVVLGGLECGQAPGSAAAVADLIVGDADAKLTLLAGCTSLGEEVNELGATAFMLLWECFEEVNASFLDALARRFHQGAPQGPSAIDLPGADSTSSDSARP